MGAMHEKNSGYFGDWDRTPKVLDRGYFLNLMASGWVPQDVSNKNEPYVNYQIVPR